MNRYLYRHCLQEFQNLTTDLTKTDKQLVLISVSAGQDSIYLIQLLEYIQTNFKSTLELQYIYIDHQWKKNSKSQIQHIINYIKCYKSKLYIYQIKQQAHSETQARINRYQIIFNHAKTHHNNIIITGHNLTDKIETFLQNLLKGTSIDGATSLSKYRKNINNIILFRPLLNTSRNEIQWLCRHFYLPIWSDQTNYYYNITRNRIRNELLPYLKNYFTNSVEKQFNSFLKISDIDNEYLKQNTIKFYLLIRHYKLIAINYKAMKRQHSAIQHRILQLFSFHHFNKLFNKELVEKIILRLKYVNEYQYLEIKWNIKKTICIHKQWLYIN
uniref:tRNA(Ile)-lysidine synthase n=1 Tax=Ceramothamnion japonicum TaxID=218448 RepID=A0A1C9CDA2_CERJP|nr:tRNA(Ile)-lysidine synthase [Ceramium japonicum]AOM66368.1 tRNA(Ile)-lysidine synthase [Ceramium japonicum]